MQPIRPQDATSVYQRQTLQGAEVGRTAGDTDARRAGTAGDAGAARRTDRVTVSSQAQELYRTMQAVSRQDDVRADRVAQLKAQIDNGTYPVDADGIARRLVEGGFGA